MQSIVFDESLWLTWSVCNVEKSRVRKEILNWSDGELNVMFNVESLILLTVLHGMMLSWNTTSLDMRHWWLTRSYS